MSLVKAIMKKQKSMGIGSKIALAAAIGVSAATIYKLYRNGTRPNARTINAYAKFLRVKAAKVASLAGVAEGISQSRMQAAGKGSKARGRAKRSKA